MDDGELKSKLAEVLGREAEATRRVQGNRERMKKWVQQQGARAFQRVQDTLNNLGVQDLSARWEDSQEAGTISFHHGDKTFEYRIDLTVSPKGITGTTHIRAPGQEERTHGPVDDIVKWTQEQIVDDFVKGLDSWHPERK